MLVGQRLTDDPDVRPLKRSLAWRAADRVFAETLDRASLQYVFYPSSLGVAADPWFRAADVVQLYNTHGSYFSHTALPLLSRRRPVVWRLSDMWAFTGHVTYSYDCERWRHGCGACPYLDLYPRLTRDTTALLWRVKRAAYARSRLTLVAPSRWLARLVGESPLLGRFDVRLIPNGIDLDRFRPDRKAEARARLGLEGDAPVVLFSAPSLADPRKGGRVLAEALGRLDDVDLQLVVAGPGEPPPFPRPVRALGALHDEGAIAASYAAADLLVLPTLAENLPNAVLESLACATPVVSFEVGGVPDAVRHLETGWLAPAGDPAGLAEGIRAVVTDRELRERLGRSGRELVEREFGGELEARRFTELYEEVLAAR
jgi:glycosyltransferase involved in cell wall biosynthesis